MDSALVAQGAFLVVFMIGSAYLLSDLQNSKLRMNIVLGDLTKFPTFKLRMNIDDVFLLHALITTFSAGAVAWTDIEFLSSAFFYRLLTRSLLLKFSIDYLWRLVGVNIDPIWTSTHTNPHMLMPADPANKYLRDNECGVCREPFTDPIQLPCLHVFCKQCARMTFSRMPAEADVNMPCCPMCRQSAEVPYTGVSSQLLYAHTLATVTILTVGLDMTRLGICLVGNYTPYKYLTLFLSLCNLVVSSLYFVGLTRAYRYYQRQFWRLIPVVPTKDLLGNYLWLFVWTTYVVFGVMCMRPATAGELYAQ